MLYDAANLCQTVMNDRANALAWASHIDGATEIARMRGKKQLRTKIGQSLFMCVRTLMVSRVIPDTSGAKFVLSDNKLHHSLQSTSPRYGVVVRGRTKTRL